MSGYAKRIALIKTLKAGYSADGGPLKGLVRCEAYAGFLKVEASLINFAPLSEGRLMLGVSDGDEAVIFEGISSESETPFDLSRGFGCLICYCRAGDVLPVACAVSGDMQGVLSSIESAVRQSETPQSAVGKYDDEAIAEENYYELETHAGGGTVRKAEGEKEEGFVRRGKEGYDNGFLPREDKADGNQNMTPPRTDGAREHDESAKPRGDLSCARDEENVDCVRGEDDEKEGGGANGGCARDKKLSDGGTYNIFEQNASVNSAQGNGEDGDKANSRQENFEQQKGASGEGAKGGLAGGNFYARMSGEIKKIFSVYPRAAELEEVMEGSRWVKISYGGGKHYAFGVLSREGEAAYICYGVPVEEGAPCPESLAERAGYIPVEGGGYWVMYQDASTGVSVKIKNT